MHRMSLGNVELTVLEDGTWRFPARAFFDNVAEARWRAEIDVDEDGKIPVGHNCALVESRDDVILIDTGYGADTHGDCTGHLLAELERAGRRPEDVTLVINTHAHGDHIKGNTQLRDGVRMPTFPRAHYVIGRRDWERFDGPAGRHHEFAEHVAFLARLGRLILAEGDEHVSPDVRLLPTPGHTPGHVSVAIDWTGGTAIFLGDLCHHPLHVAHPDWVSEFDTHPRWTPQTRAALFDLAAELEAVVICPHALPPGVGLIERDGRGYRWRDLT